MPASDIGATYTSGRRPKTRGGWGAENAAHCAMGIWLMRIRWPCDDAEKRRQRLAVPRLWPAPPVDMTIVCIDILETILIESRNSNGQPLFRRT
jgi:hypothetical protein